MPGGSGRGGLGSSEVRARSGLKVAGEALVGTHGHVGVLKQWRPRAKMELGGGGVKGVAAQAWRARGGGRPLNRRLRCSVT
jgi:hypothetical protein